MARIYELLVTHQVCNEKSVVVEKYFATYEAAKSAASMFMWNIIEKNDGRERGRRCQETTWKVRTMLDGMSMYRNEDLGETFERYVFSLFKHEVEGE